MAAGVWQQRAGGRQGGRAARGGARLRADARRVPWQSKGGKYGEEEASMAEAMLSRLTSKERAKELAGKAQQAAASLRGSFWSAPAAASSSCAPLARDKADGSDSQAAGGDGEASGEAAHTRQLRLEKLALLDRCVRLPRQPSHHALFCAHAPPALPPPRPLAFGKLAALIQKRTRQAAAAPAL